MGGGDLSHGDIVFKAETTIIYLLTKLEGRGFVANSPGGGGSGRTVHSKPPFGTRFTTTPADSCQTGRASNQTGINLSTLYRHPPAALGNDRNV